VGPLLAWESGYWPLWFFTFAFSLLDASFPVIWATVGDFFGRRNFATIRGAMSFFYMWGSFAGPIMAGIIYDRTESYTLALWIMLALLVFATLLTMLLIHPWAIRTAYNQAPQLRVTQRVIRSSPSPREGRDSNS
jgi:MFS family permease